MEGIYDILKKMAFWNFSNESSVQGQWFMVYFATRPIQFLVEIFLKSHSLFQGFQVFYLINKPFWCDYAWTTEALDGRAVRKISKRHFFQDIKNSFHGVTQIGLKPHQNFLKIFFSTNTVARGVQSFCILEGATHPLI